MAQTKRGRGRPKKLDHTDVNKIKDAIETEINKQGANAASNLAIYFSQIDKMAKGELKGATPTNIISSCKYMIEFSMQYLEGKEEEEVEDSEETKSTKQEATEPQRLISLAYNGD